MTMIEVDGLTKRYGELKAVDNISFAVERGEILGFLGPNGAGKSTTMKMLSCFIAPTRGTARICGKDILAHSLEVRKMIGYLPENAPSYKDMTVKEFLRFVAEIRGYRKAEADSRIESVIETTFLEQAQYQTINTLSKGYRQRVGFAQTLIHDPPVLILDEPTDGLDPNQKHEVRTLIKNMSQNKAIILSTHILEEMEAVCSRAIIINSGAIVADGTPEELLSKSLLYRAVSVTLLEKPTAEILGELKELTDVRDIEQEASPDVSDTYKLRIYPKKGKNPISEVTRFVSERKLNIAGIFSEKGKMDEVFRNLTIG